jgi:Phosphotransferase enzyme family
MPDLAAVRAFLQRVCQTPLDLGRLEATYVQAGAMGPARVLYEMPVDGKVLRVAARRVPPAKGPGIEASINARAPRPHTWPGFTRAALYAPGLDLLFQVFPMDDGLPGLTTAVDESAMAAVLRQLLAPHVDGAHLRSLAVEVMRYKPERKCLLRYDLAWSGGDRIQPPTVVWARLSRRSKFERTAHVLPRIRRAAADIGFDLPQPYGTAPDLCMEFAGRVPGVAVFADVRRDDFPAVCRRVGNYLWRFHALPVEVDDVFDQQAQARRLTENAAEFAWLFPGETTRIADIERELVARLCRTTSSLRLIHRDFHGDNILIADSGRLALLDFEDCSMGEAADDVGSNWA